MSRNLRKFDSVEAYENYRSTDGWVYPAVNVIENEVETQVHYNNELRMRWYDADTAKTPTFSGDISHDQFKAWVDAASHPCEIKKDLTGFNYLKMSGNNVADFTLLSTGAASHYNTDDKNDYFQMTEVHNVNVGLFQNSTEGWKEVRFNFDKGCPTGFHKWFAHPYWNATLKDPITGKNGVWTKLLGRYDVTPTLVEGTTAGTTVDIAYGCSQGGHNVNNWSANLILQKLKATHSTALLSMTYWEHLVLTYIFSAYYKTFDHQSIFNGLLTDYTNNSGGWTNGQTDTILTPHGGLTKLANGNQAYKFMHMENSHYGKQWIWGAGFVGDANVSPSKWYMTFDDIVANKTATMARTDADVVTTSSIAAEQGQYINKIDLWGVPQSASGGSSSTGFYDGLWVSANSSRVAWLGGASYYGAFGGGFARDFDTDAAYSFWIGRCRASIVRS